jgi:hypothetical protein
MIIAGISFLDPLLYDSAYSLKRREQIGAKDVLLINEDKNFGMIILSWFPQFKQHQLNFMGFYPFRHGLRNQLRSIIHPDPGWISWREVMISITRNTHKAVGATG